jgi:hypothetical protein
MKIVQVYRCEQVSCGVLGRNRASIGPLSTGFDSGSPTNIVSFCSVDMGVPMSVMEVRVMRMLVSHWHVPVPVAMGFTRLIVRAMRVLVVGIMSMPMLVLDRIVLVFMLMRFGQVQIKADRHQDTRTDQTSSKLLMEHGYREQRAHERGRREVSTCSCGPQVA